MDELEKLKKLVIDLNEKIVKQEDSISKLEKKNSEVILKAKSERGKREAEEEEKNKIASDAKEKALEAEGKHKELLDHKMTEATNRMLKIEAERDALDQELRSAKNEIKKDFIEKELREAFIKSGVEDPDIINILVSSKAHVADIEGEGSEKKMIVGGISVEDFIKEFSNGVGKKFIPAPNSGSGANGGDSDIISAGGVEKYFKPGDDYNLSKQYEVKKSNGELFKELKNKYPQ